MDTLDDMTTKYSAAKLSIAGADTERETLFESLVLLHMSQRQSYDRPAKKPTNYAALNEGTIPYPVVNEAAGGMATQGDGNGSEPAMEEIATDSDMSEKLVKLVEETQWENERLQKQLVFQQKQQELEALKQENQRLAAEISALQRGQRIGRTAGNSNTRATAVVGDPAAGSVNNNAPTIADLRANATLSMQADNAPAALGLVEDSSD